MSYGRPDTGPRRTEGPHRLLWYVCAAAVVIIYALVAFRGVGYTSTGDEPHYLLDAISLAHDGDRDLRNQYGDPAQVALAYDAPLTPDGQSFNYGGSPELRSTHGAGLAALLTPAALIAPGVVGGRVTMTVLSMAMALLLLSVLLCLALAPRWASVTAWASVVFLLPVVAFVDQIYPEVPGALMGLVALRVLVARARPLWAVALASAAASSLPWFNVRFATLSLLLLAALAVRTWQDAAPAPARSRLTVRHLAALLALPFAQAALFLVLNHRWYASFSPTAPYEPLSFYASSTTPPRVYEQAVGNLLSPVFGWLPQAPVHLLGLAGLGLLVARRPRWGAFGVVTVLSYLTVVGSSGFGSVAYAFPARLHLVVIPLVSLPLAMALTRGRVVVVAYVVLAAVSASLTLPALHERTRLIPTDVVTAQGTVATPAARAMSAMWPDFRRPTVTTVSFSQTELQRTVGAVSQTPVGPVAVSTVEDGPGYLTFGPYRSLPTGRWRAAFHLARGQAKEDAPVATVDVTANQTGSDSPGLLVIGSRTLTTQDLPADGSFATVELPFQVLGGEQLQTRVQVFGGTLVRAGGVDLIPIQDPFGSSRDVKFPDAALSLAWLSGVVLVGALLMQRGHSIERPAFAEGVRARRQPIRSRRAGL